MPRDLEVDFQALLLSVFETLGAATGDAFFETLARCAAEGVGADIALIGALEPGGRAVRSLAVLEDGAAQPQIVYHLRGTPCENVVETGACVIEDDLQARFPHDATMRELGIVAYAGAPVRDHEGRAVGLIALMARRRFANAEMLPPLLRAVARRIGAEIEHAETERRLRAAEERAQLMEQRLRDGIEAMPAGFALFDAEDRLVLCNTAYRRDTGLLGGAPVEDGARFEDILRRNVASGRMIDPLALSDPDAYLADRLARHAAPDGSPIEQAMEGARWAEVVERRTADGGVVIVRSDVTARKRSELRLLDAIASIPFGFIMCDPDDRLLLVNRRYRELYPEFGDALTPGTPFADLCEICAREIDASVDGRARARWIAERMARHRAPGAPSQHQTRGGRSLLVSESRTSEGGYIGVHADITPLVLMHHELRAASESAAAALAVKSRFLATMSHELRTPLNAILGFSELMAHEVKGPLPEAYREYVSIIRSSGEFLLSLITDILDLSRIEAGKMQIERAPLALGPLATESVAMLSEMARRKRLVLRAEIEEDLPLILADRRRILQILHNLLSNAVKFTERGAVVASARRAGDAVALSVRDSGRGMTPEEIEEALVPFQQARSLSGAEKLQGTGLGLSIVKALVELHEGALEIRSAPGAGTTVEIRLPAAPGAVGLSSRPASAE